MRFVVPQFIEVEDKIFGPLTWKQFVYLAGGVGLAAVLFFTTPIYIFAIFGLPIGGLAFVLAFYPVNNRPFSLFLESVFRFYNGNRTYHWKRNSNVVYKDLTAPKPSPAAKDFKKKQAHNGTGDNINSLSKKLELNALQKDI